MAELIKLFRPRLAAAGVVATLTLGGCSATHVADSWQCPLTQGQVCSSVAAADPAVLKTGDGRALATRTPLYRTRPAPPGPPRCTGACNPFAWLASLFETNEGGTPAATGGDGDDSAGAPARLDEATADDTVSATNADAETAAISTPATGVATAPVPVDADLRTDEVIGRIWIAPFVDADGLYHEASWVRVVLEPSGWRLQ